MSDISDLLEALEERDAAIRERDEAREALLAYCKGRERTILETARLKIELDEARAELANASQLNVARTVVQGGSDE